MSWPGSKMFARIKTYFELHENWKFYLKFYYYIQSLIFKYFQLVSRNICLFGCKWFTTVDKIIFALFKSVFFYYYYWHNCLWEKESIRFPGVIIHFRNIIHFKINLTLKSIVEVLTMLLKKSQYFNSGKTYTTLEMSPEMYKPVIFVYTKSTTY